MTNFICGFLRLCGRLLYWRPLSRLVRDSDAHFHSLLRLQATPAGSPPPAGQLWQAIYRHRVVGSLTLSARFGEIIKRPSWWIVSAYVSPWHRRRGIYRRLLRAAIQAARQAGIATVFAVVRKGNLAANKALQQEGFVLCTEPELWEKVRAYYARIAGWTPETVLVWQANLTKSAPMPE